MVGAYNRREAAGFAGLADKSCSASWASFWAMSCQMLMSTSKFNMVRFLRMGTFWALVRPGHLFYKNLEKRIPGYSRNAVVQKSL